MHKLIGKLRKELADTRRKYVATKKRERKLQQRLSSNKKSRQS